MHRILMERAEDFHKKIEEVNNALKDGWDIYEGPYPVGQYICIKLIKPSNTVDSTLKKFEEDNHEW